MSDETATELALMAAGVRIRETTDLDTGCMLLRTAAGPMLLLDRDLTAEQRSAGYALALVRLEEGNAASAVFRC